MLKKIFLIFIFVNIATLPFINKPFHIDEPLFLYSARSINKNIVMPYNFSFPAENRIRTGFDGFTNPPLNSYFIALISHFFGEREMVLHSFFIIFAIFASFSILMLSSLFVKNTLLATFLSITTPVFILQSHSLMPDIAVLGFWCFAIYFFVKGLNEYNKRLLFLSSVFISLALLSRYNGILLILLLFIYSLLNRNKISLHILYLLIPIFVFVLWCLHNIFLYGRMHILSPIMISLSFYMNFRNILPRVILNFIYIGSLMIFPVCFAFLFLLKVSYDRKKYLIITLILYLLSFLYLYYLRNSLFNLIFYSFIAAFCFLFFIWVILESSQLRNDSSKFNIFKDDLFLFIWILMIIAFQSSLYFTAPKFTLLILPPIVFLLFRLLERRYSNLIGYTKIVILISVTLGFFICIADHLQAIFDSKEIPKILKDYSRKYRKTLWIIDQDRSWGYYIPEEFSAIYNQHEFKEGDLILGTPYFFKEAINKKDLYVAESETIYYKASFPKICNLKNNVFLYFDGFGKYLPYSLSLEKVPMFIIWEVKSKSKIY